MNALNKSSESYDEYERLKNDKKIDDNIITFVDGINLSNPLLDWSYIRYHQLFNNKNSSVFSLNVSDNPASGDKKAFGAKKIGVYMSVFGNLGDTDNVDVKKRVKVSRKSDGQIVLTSKELYKRVGLLRWAEKCGLTYNDDSTFSKLTLNDLKKTPSVAGDKKEEEEEKKDKSFLFIFLFIFILYKVFQKK